MVEPQDKIALTRDEMARVLTMFSLVGNKNFKDLTQERADKIKTRILQDLEENKVDVIVESLNLYEDLKLPIEQRKTFNQEYLDKLQSVASG